MKKLIWKENREYIKKQNASGFKENDKVIVVKLPVENYQSGWGFTTFNQAKVGQIGTIMVINKCGIRVKIPGITTKDSAIWYPYWCLEKFVPAPILYRERIDSGKVDIATLDKGWDPISIKPWNLNIHELSGKTNIYKYYVKRE